jgi:hypothetical protein
MHHATKMNEVVKQAAATTKHAAATTAHTLSTLVGDAQERIEDLSLPVVTPRRRKHSRRRPVLVMVVAFAVAAIVVVRRRSGAKDPMPDSAPTARPDRADIMSPHDPTGTDKPVKTKAGSATKSDLEQLHSVG